MGECKAIGSGGAWGQCGAGGSILASGDVRNVRNTVPGYRNHPQACAALHSCSSPRLRLCSSGPWGLPEPVCWAPNPSGRGTVAEKPAHLGPPTVPTQTRCPPSFKSAHTLPLSLGAHRDLAWTRCQVDLAGAGLRGRTEIRSEKQVGGSGRGMGL